MFGPEPCELWELASECLSRTSMLTLLVLTATPLPHAWFRVLGTLAAEPSSLVAGAAAVAAMHEQKMTWLLQ